VQEMVTSFSFLAFRVLMIMFDESFKHYF
jgi:hypothetical protein